MSINESEDRSPSHTWTFFCLLASLFFCTWVIVAHGSAVPLADQEELLAFARGPLRFDNGIVSMLFVKALGIFDSSNERYNLAVKLCAMALYLATSYALARVTLYSLRLLPLFLILLVVSRQPFLWNSKEVIGGILFNLAFLSYFSQARGFLLGALVAMAALGKPENLVFSSLFFGFIFFETKDSERRWELLRGFSVISFFAFLVMFFQPSSNDGMARATAAIRAHYGVLVYKHQCCLPRTTESLGKEIPPTSDFREPNVAKSDPLSAWLSTEILSSPLVDGKTGLSQLIRSNWRRYFDFLALALIQTTINLFSYCPIPLLAFALHRRTVRREQRKVDICEKVLLIGLLGYLPYFFISYFHIRYLARILPLALIVFLNIFMKEPDSGMRRIFGLLLLATLFWWLIPFYQELQWVTPEKQFFWPD